MLKNNLFFNCSKLIVLLILTIAVPKAIYAYNVNINDIVLNHYRNKFPEIEKYATDKYKNDKNNNLYKLGDVKFRIVEQKNVDNVFVLSILKGGYANPYDIKYSKIYLCVFDKSRNKISADFNLSDKYYGASTYDTISLDCIQVSKNNTYVFYQSRQGGDGDHMENRLRVFLLRSDSLVELLNANIHEARIINEGEIIKIIGDYVLTFCMVCDGWEVSEPDDIFKIPIEITIRDTKVIKKSLLAKKDKGEMIERFNNIKENRIKRGEEEEIKFINKLNKEFFHVINM